MTHPVNFTVRFKSVNGNGINGNLPHMNSDTLQPPPPPPLLKKVKTEALRPAPQPAAAILFPTAAAQPMIGLEDALLPMPSNCIKTAPDSYTCALCNATYGNMVSFRQHTKFHEDERDREQRNLMLNNMVSMCYSKNSKLQYLWDNMTLLGIGKFKVHLGIKKTVMFMYLFFHLFTVLNTEADESMMNDA